MNTFFKSAGLWAVLATTTVLCGTVPVLAQGTPFDSFTASTPAPQFDDPIAAVDKLKAALSSGDVDGLAALLGIDAAKLKANEDAMNTYRQIREGAAKQVVVEDRDGKKIVEIGDKLWPLPFPLAKRGDGKWAFDTKAGFEEILDRRIGENELQAIDTMRNYVDAQQEYASADHDGDGVLEYAQNLISSPGKTDGLYWPPNQGDSDSPAGAFVEQAALERAKAGDGYFGYRFRILKGQGANIAGGDYSYIINGNMIVGFALVGWPVKYGETGVKTFLVSEKGVVYERDLGTNTAAAVAKMTRFNPDEKWDIVPN